MGGAVSCRASEGVGVSRNVNGGGNKRAEREAFTRKALRLLEQHGGGVPAETQVAPVVPRTPRYIYELGSFGSQQEALTRLGGSSDALVRERNGRHFVHGRENYASIAEAQAAAVARGHSQYAVVPWSSNN